MNIETVNELIASLESAGELSIREQKFLKLAKAFKQMAAENVALKESRNNLAEFIHEELDADYPLNMNLETHATDRFVAGIKADGVGEFIGRLQQCVDEGDFVGDEVAVIVGAIDCGKEFCEQLREGVDK
ncbi:TPA: hypothetical protein MIR57_04420 [Klebsiella pneumoniae]|jgi:hypothetical protein|uniref:hypothetical protein n=1 Tax=Klebsiella pneumoniae TaxID=573 RepID=UPI0008FB18FF|nr:hypothetical protein [Klebsiella pneumoniae]MDN6919584.1 hypothetical protein [Klebsiella pneumoniae]OKN11614.1 hypothetical protein AM337_000524 [Klebsiella pneumoniae]TYE69012.1 hypothetical protein DJ513_23700 [Klebsiella pneumoniae]TYE70059.1 hypothetical protein DJ507_23915 [Klebsiella pneumoniae]TYE82390.1 hypothetical protein DJ514_23535 [Klebsiella pneumoniae]